MRPDTDLVTVLIPALDEAASIGACLDAVQAQDYQHLQIVVVDNGSTDDTVEIVRRHRAADGRVEVVECPRPRIPAALNAGLSVARGRWLVRIDAHSTVGPDYVRLAVGRLAEGRWGGVGGRKDGVGVTRAGRAIAAAMGSRFGVGGSTYHHGTTAREVDHVAFGAYPLEILRGLGGWDENIAANEDFEMDQRIREAGWPLLFDPQLVVAWQCRQSIPDLFGQYRRYGSGKVAVAARHPGSVRLRHVLPPAAVAYFAAAAVLGLWRPRLSMLMVSPYLTAVGLAGASTARTLNSPAERALVAPAFVAMHVGWGVGFWIGVARAVRHGLRADGEA